MKNTILIISALFLLFNCTEQKVINPQTLVDKSIAVSGGDKIKNSIIEFDFRNKHYKATRNNGYFKLERTFKDSTDIVRDVLANEGFERFINDEILQVSDSMIPKYSASVNSVHYFSVLPHGLNDVAVNKTYVEKVTVKEKTYHKIKVTFDEAGGGEDFEDVFVYWIDAESYKTKYIAYSYNENHGKGLRFREAYNERYVDGIRFVDYKNYKPKENTLSVTDLDRLFEKNQLELVSKIDLENISVE